jgi:transposase
MDGDSSSGADRRDQPPAGGAGISAELPDGREDRRSRRTAGLPADGVSRPKLEPYLPRIAEILEADKQAPKKQRHTAQRILDRLVAEHGFDGCYSSVKEAVRAWRQGSQEVFLPLSHPPGEAQVDFGFVEIDLAGERIKAALFVMTLPYSDAVFVQAFPRECTEVFQEGHKRAFEFFGGVPTRISYDNAKVAVTKITGSRVRQLTREFLWLASHYLFAHHFCLVRRANEKGKIEGHRKGDILG